MPARPRRFIEQLLGDESFKRWIPPNALTQRWDAPFYHPAFDEIAELAADRPGQLTPLRNICSAIVTHYATKGVPSATASGVFPYVTTASFHSGQFVDLKASGQSVFESEANPPLLNQESVLISLVSGVPHYAAFYSPAIHGGPIALSGSIIALAPGPDVDAAYLAHELTQRYVTLQLFRLPAGSTIPLLNIHDVLDVFVAVPSRAQQEKLAQSVRARASLLEAPPTETAPELAGPAGATFAQVIENVENELLKLPTTAQLPPLFLEWQPDEPHMLFSNVWALPRAEQKLVAKKVSPPSAFLDWAKGTTEPFCIFNSIQGTVVLDYSFCRELKLVPNGDPRKVSALFSSLEAWKEAKPVGVRFQDFLAANRPVQRAFSASEEALQVFAKCCPPLLALRINRLGRPYGVLLVAGPPQWPDEKGAHEALRSQGVIWASYLRQQLQLLPQLQKLAAEQTVTNLVHRLNHPLNNIDVAVDQLIKWAGSSGVGEQLLPDEATARELAVDRNQPLASYSATAWIRRIRDAHGELLNLSRKIRLMARAETHSNPTWVPVAPLGKSLWDCVQSQLHGKPCELVNKVQVDAEGVVYADPDLLCEALRNVVDNAYREMVHVPPRIEVSFRTQAPQQGSALIEVVDNGLPADKDLIDGAFDWGTTGHFSSGKGSGYGLPIVRQIFSAVLGVCDLEKNATGPGCRFLGTLQHQINKPA